MTDLWQGTRVTPNPHLQLLTSDQALLPGPSAALLLYDPAHTLEALQAQADSFGLALIRPASLTSAGEEAKEAQGDGYWTGDVRLLKALRQGQPDWQLIGLAQDRHGAMVMGEAGADLILFTVFDPGTDLPRLLPGDPLVGKRLLEGVEHDGVGRGSHREHEGAAGAQRGGHHEQCRVDGSRNRAGRKDWHHQGCRGGVAGHLRQGDQDCGPGAKQFSSKA